MRRDTSIEVGRCPHVYGPEEDSELMLQATEVAAGQTVLEVGCGTGLVALHCSKAGAAVVAVDVDPLAVRCASANADRNGLAMEVRLSDLFSAVTGSFDLILFNPPYLEGDCVGQQDLAWAGGAGGMDILSRFLDDAPAHLSDGGRILMIVSSDMDQDRLRRELARFRCRVAAEATLFFEVLMALELTL
jgi:release factor glutamine methyltransferase